MAAGTQINLKTLGYVILYVKDSAKALSFYRDILGLKVKVDEQGWVELDTGSVTLALHSNPSLPASREEHTVVCFTVDNVDACYADLKARGIKFDKEPQVVCEGEVKDTVGKAADFKDPDGNKLSIFGFVSK